MARTGALVGAGAVVSNDTEVPSRAMALGVPARIKPDAVDPASLTHGRDIYVENGRRYAKHLRRIEGY